MAKKSKTQRAKASAARQQRKATREQEAAAAEAKAAADNSQEESDNAAASVKKVSKEITTTSTTTEVKKKAEDNKPKKKHFQFFRDVRAELRRVTWPSRREVLRWTGVVVVALLFFGIFVAVLDNLVVTPILYGVSSIGA